MQADWKRSESDGGCEWIWSSSFGGDPTLGSAANKIQQQDDWTWRSTQGNKHRIDFLGIAQAVQRHVHSCAPTDVMMFGCGHFQDHRAVVLHFTNVEMTNPQVARQYRTAICDRQLLLQESVQCSLQQWWQATPCLPHGLTPNQSDALLAKWMRCGLFSMAPQTKKKPKQPWMDRATLDQVLSESTWRRQWFRLQQATLCLKKKFWFSVWQMGVAPVQVADAHNTLLTQTCLISVPVTQLSACSEDCQTGAATVLGKACRLNCKSGEQ